MNLVLCIGGDPQQFQNSFNQNSILFRNGKQTSQSFEAILGNSLTIGNEENYQEGVEFLREALPGEPANSSDIILLFKQRRKNRK